MQVVFLKNVRRVWHYIRLKHYEELSEAYIDPRTKEKMRMAAQYHASKLLLP